MLPRIYLTAPIRAGALLAVPDEAAHYLGNVLRLAADADIELFDGQGGQWRAQLLRQGKQLMARPMEYGAPQREAPLQLTLAQALVAADKMDWIVQKSVELGVLSIQPVATARSVVRLAPERMARRVEHWRQIAIAACAQCGRNFVPSVCAVKELVELTRDNPAATRWALSPEAPQRLSSLPAPQTTVTLLVGPEGGFEENEALLIRQAGFTPVSLGPRILRTETAGLAALAAMQALWGDF